MGSRIAQWVSPARMEYAAHLSQILSLILFFGSVLLLGWQVSDANRIAARAEAAALLAKWSDLRSSIYGDAGTAEMFADGLRNEFEPTFPK